MDKKRTIGSYYTPKKLADFMGDYCLSRLDKKNISILEPSVGDGIFISSICNFSDIEKFNKISLNIVEREKEELQKALKRQTLKHIKVNGVNSDYLDFHFNDKKKYSLIIGNPPYVKKNYLDDSQKELAKTIHLQNGLANKSIHNIWSAFVISALEKLESNGILAFVLPLELLQVTFAKEIRDLLQNKLERLEIFMFNELQFHECKGQDTVVLIGYKNHKEKGTFYTTIESSNQLENQDFCLNQNISVSSTNKKWTHHFITPEENIFLENLRSQLKPVSNYLDNRPGVVTACNKYFIVNFETLEKYQLSKYAKPIVQKGQFVNGSISFTEENHKTLVESNKPAFLLDFNIMKDRRVPKKVKQYLEIGELEEINLRHKCELRKKWYQIPNISKEAEGFFFKRAHNYPKVIKNDAKVHVTDSAYKIEMKENKNIDDFIYSFYNSLTLAYAELEGRYYGGGVLELTPNEFRTLPIPYISVKDFKDYKQLFESKTDINEITKRFNSAILNSVLGLNSEEINKIQKIKDKLVDKRLKT